MRQTVDEALCGAALYTDGQAYRLLQLPPSAMTLAAGVLAEAALPFSALLADKDEVTLLLPDAACQEFARRLQHAEIGEQVYRLITFDIALESTLVGFMARVSGALAGAGIPILTYAAFSRDHIVVRAQDFDASMRALEALQQAAAQG